MIQNLSLIRSLIGNHPTAFPTITPSHSPTKTPTYAPTKSPTDIPTKTPTRAPTCSPTVDPLNINLASLLPSQGFTINGIADNDQSGTSVSGIGDVNGDGYEDVIIGAPNANSFIGTSYIIFGNNISYDFTTINLGYLQPSQGSFIYGDSTISKENFGFSVSGIGDFNGDGFDDFSVGAPSEGRAYILLGQENFPYQVYLESSLGTTLQGFYVYGPSKLGSDVSNAGDINKDGYDDLVVCASSTNPYYYYVILGKNSSFTNINLANNLVSSAQGFTITGNAYSDTDGSDFQDCSVANAGDINGDGFNDIIIGEPNASPCAQGSPTCATTYKNAGSSFIIFGNSTQYLRNIVLSTTVPLPSNQGITINGIVAGGFSGFSVSGLGDINGDHNDDIIVGAPFVNSKDGICYVILGQSNLPSLIYLNSTTYSGFIIKSSISSYNYGTGTVGNPRYLRSAGDVNGDGYKDIIIGALYSSSSGKSANGNAYVIFGKTGISDISLSNLDATEGFVIYGANSNDNLGVSVSAAGDINNDGYSDVIIGALFADPNSINAAGASYVIFGKVTPTPNPTSAPTLYPTLNPTMAPTLYPTKIPTVSPSMFPTRIPTAVPTAPSAVPTVIPTAPTHAPTSLPTFIPSAKPTAPTFIPTASPSVIPTHKPTSVPTIIPTSAPTFIPTLKPTSMPTSPNIFINEKQTSVTSTAEFKVGFSLGSFLLSLVGGWFFRTKIAFYVLNNWGHNYKLVYQDSKEILKNNEIALSLRDDQLICTIKGNTYSIIPEDIDHNGISRILYNKIKSELKHKTDSFVLVSYEKSLIRNFLINYKYLTTTNILCLKSFSELGYIKGSIYNLFLNYFEEVHTKECKKHVSDGIRQVSMEVFSKSDLQNIHDDNKAQNPMIKAESLNGIHDIESAQVYYVYKIYHDAPLLNHPQSSEILKYAYEIGGARLVSTLISYKGYVSDDAEEVKNIIKDLFAETAAIKDKPIFDSLESGSIKTSKFQSCTSNSLIKAFLDIQSIIESYPLVKYISSNIVYPLVENYLPESLQNITLPEISNTMLVTVHMTIGHLYAWQQPQGNVPFYIVESVAKSGSFAARLGITKFINDYKDVLSQNEQTITSTEAIKHCVSTVLTYTVPDLLICAAAKAAMPSYECGDLKLGAKLSFAGSECYWSYKASQETIAPTTADLVVPYIADVAAGITAYANGYGLMGVVTSVVATDWMSKMVMDYTHE